MPEIYVANTMMQALELNYRVPLGLDQKTGRRLWSERLRVERIPAGGQIRLANGQKFTDEEAKVLFEHHESHYGARRPEQHRKGFQGLIFSDAQIDVQKIEESIAQNKDAAEQRSNTMLEATAQAMLDKQTERARETDAAVPDRLELEVAAETSKDIDVGGKGAEAVRPGVAPTTRAIRGK